MSLTVAIARSAPKAVDALGVPVASEGAVPRSLGLSRSALAGNGFEGKAGQTLVIPSSDGPALIAVGIGKPGELTVNGLRNAAASFARAAGKRAALATTLADLDVIDSGRAAQAVVEGVNLANYRYGGLKSEAVKSPASSLALIVSAKRSAEATLGAARGQVTRLLRHSLATSPTPHPHP